jgi:hypothetical protein
MLGSQRQDRATPPKAWWRGRQAVILVATAAAVTAVVLGLRLLRTDRAPVVTGTILRDHADAREQLPVPGAVVTASAGASTAQTESDASGFFHLRLEPAPFVGDALTLQVRHSDYEPLELSGPADRKIHVVRITPKDRAAKIEQVEPKHTIGNVRVRYGVKDTTVVNIGSAVKSFEAVNAGNVPCEKREPCSPDGRWKGAVASVTLDAGEGNRFGRIRVSCIAGPCPFSKVQKEELSADGRQLEVGVLNWSDTVTYLVEAEVTDAMVRDTVRHSYPVIFGASMNFTLPPSAQGPSIEAELDDQNIVFPLGPKLILSWASCSAELSPDGTQLYRCDLKPGFRFE